MGLSPSFEIQKSLPKSSLVKPHSDQQYLIGLPDIEPFGTLSILILQLTGPELPVLRSLYLLKDNKVTKSEGHSDTPYAGLPTKLGREGSHALP